MQTIRDAQMVEWLGRMGAASAEQVSERFGLALALRLASEEAHDVLGA